MKLRIGIVLGFILAGTICLRAQDNFQVSYSASSDESVEWIIQANDGNLVLAGNTKSVDPNGDGLVIKTDQQGSIIWSKRLGGDGLDEIVRIIACSDGGYATVGYTSSWGQGDRDAWITRIAENGDVIWSSCFGGYNFDAARGILQTADGGFIVIGHEHSFDYAIIMAINAQGEMLWKKEFYLDIVTWFNEIIENGNGGYFLTGALNWDGFGIHDTFIMETDSAGNVLRCKVYGDYSNDSFRRLIPFGDGFIAIGDTWSWEGHQCGWVARLNADLEIEKAVVIGDAGANQFLESACIKDNSIYCDIKLTNGTAYIVKLDTALDLQQSWKFNPGYSAYSSHLLEAGENGLLFAGSVTNMETDDKDIYLANFNPDDSTYDCNTVPHETFITEVEVQSANLELDEVPYYSIYEPIIFESTDFALQSDYLCPTDPPVAGFSLPDHFCTLEPFNVEDSSMYGELYHWTFEGGIPSSSDSRDPGIIVYEYPGYYDIKLVVSNEMGSDSLTREIFVWPAPEVYLGADTNLSYDAQLILDAGPGRDHYLWQDGSTGQTFEVTENGIFWVIVQQGYCFDSDTIIVSPQSSNFDHSGVMLCPNPASGSVRISNNWGELPVTVNFYNYARLKVNSMEPASDFIDVSYLEPGFYIVEMKFKAATITRRLLILN
jgi:PKD repeat protein